MDQDILITLTADIVSAHVGRGTVAANDLPRLITEVHAALANIRKPAVSVVKNAEPAVSIRSSVKPDGITCLDCGKKMKILKRHIRTDHSMSPEAYRQKWGLAADYPLIAAEYANLRKELALKIGLGRKPRSAK